MFISSTILCSCLGKKGKEVRSFSFSLPNILCVITEPVKQQEYLAAHYWDCYDFKDVAFLRSPQGDSTLINYFKLLYKIRIDESVKDISLTIRRAKADSIVCMQIFSNSEKFLYDPNSPLRNETLYAAVLKEILSWDKLNEMYKIRPRYQYSMIQRNRPGENAIDFVYTLRSGRRKKLYDIKSDYVLLYFNNPGCDACKQTKLLLSESSIINELIIEKRLKVLSIYPDEDLTEWLKYRTTMPVSWIVGYDKGTIIKSEDLYDLRAIPTLYLLDKNKHVLLKDRSFQEIEDYLIHFESTNKKASV